MASLETSAHQSLPFYFKYVQPLIVINKKRGSLDVWVRPLGNKLFSQYQTRCLSLSNGARVDFKKKRKLRGFSLETIWCRFNSEIWWKTHRKEVRNPEIYWALLQFFKTAYKFISIFYCEIWSGKLRNYHFSNFFLTRRWREYSISATVLRRLLFPEIQFALIFPPHFSTLCTFTG